MNKIMHINSTAQIKWTDFFLSHNLLTLTQEDTDNPNNTISSKKKIVSVVKNLSTKKMSGP